MHMEHYKKNSLCVDNEGENNNPWKHSKYPATQYHIPQDVNPHQHCCVNLKSFTTAVLLLLTEVLLHAKHTVLQTLMHVNGQYKFSVLKMYEHACRHTYEQNISTYKHKLPYWQYMLHHIC
jgi:hypothetical protein